ncbi:MAG: 3-phosphoshikimate 1-carboxyvinyltransferase [Bacteroidota bacterium]
MLQNEIRSIKTVERVDAEITVPPSKSYMNRALIAASLAEDQSTIINPSESDDSNYLLNALKEFGVKIWKNDSQLHIVGTNGKPNVPAKELFIGNAGTAIRFLSSFAGIPAGITTLTGDDDMKRRPMNDLLDALRTAGVKSSSANGYPPLKIHGGKFIGGDIPLKANISSQFVSSILLSAPYARHPTNLQVHGKLSSLPYVDMSLQVMRTFGGKVDFIEPSTYYIYNSERYIGQEYTIEGDASSASYFFAAAAITKGTVRIKNLSSESLQGDIKFLDILSQMGCKITKGEDFIEVRGADLLGVEVDMNEIPDCVPTASIVAAFAQNATTITNIPQLKYKETNRLKAISTELTKLGAKVELYEDSVIIHPRPLKGVTIDTYNDHRLAMSFAIAGLRVPKIQITNPSCVSKSFPRFWDEFAKLEN